MYSDKTKIIKKIAFTCIYSHPSICGVWSRVYNLSKELISRGYEVHVFSTNIIKGTQNHSPNYEEYEGIKIHRFKPWLELGANVKFWNFKKELKKIHPDLIISEVYRHPHTKQALSIAKKLKIPIFLTTHAPFVEKSLRSRTSNIIVSVFDNLFQKYINKFTRIISIAKWEYPYLKKLGIDEKKLVYIPNPIPNEFFENILLNHKRANQRFTQQGRAKRTPQILFFGRISRIKNIESLIKATKILKNKEIKFKINIIGPAEQEYLEKLKQLINKLKLDKEIEFKPPIFDIKKKIETYDEHDIFVLPSWREAMPVSLLEAGARGLTLVSSKTLGALETIEDKKTGYLFQINNEKEFAEKIIEAIKKPINSSSKIKKYSIGNITNSLENLYKAIKK